MAHPPVTFFYPYPDELAQCADWSLTDPRPWSVEGQERRRAWILQTYLHMRAHGYHVNIAPVLPTEGIVVFIPEVESLHALRRQYTRSHRALTFVTVRADVIEFRSPWADAEIVQNGRFADGHRSFFVPHWPQPGIIPRDPSRGARIEHITFKGGFGSLDKAFRSEPWQQFLDERGLTFEIASKHTQSAVPRWHDYEHADLMLAVRPLHGDGGQRCEKPASKLVNAWMAGVPALVGPEYAFRELREDPLDYVEVGSLRDAMDAIDALRDDPDRYHAMRAHGLQRAQAFTPTCIAERWAEVLFEHVPALERLPTRRWAQRLPLPLRQGWNMATSPPSLFELRKIGGQVYRSLRS
ncbi:hypothetical protein CRI93_01520 [Longimonas halophila]|uniref:Glycosyltransferase n=1 Tax=Longimonas halophila TaxID=1469170 RepID=A0A2H3NQT2_9BACT|nr:glycosyltransferase [Longimonas halophila]PEN09432.1 hypothetical protein CRI93_01520 [Longimonas halophila]